MKKGILLIFIGVFLVSGMAMAKGPQEDEFDLPENKWWQNERVVKGLKLTEPEQSQLNDLLHCDVWTISNKQYVIIMRKRVVTLF